MSWYVFLIHLWKDVHKLLVMTGDVKVRPDSEGYSNPQVSVPELKIQLESG